MKNKKRTYGIRKRVLAYMAVLLALALFFSSISVWVYVRKNMTGALLDSYEFMTEKMGRSLDSLYTKSVEVTADCILDDDVQKSLLSAGLTEIEQSSLSKYFAYVDLEQMDEYCYVDNHGNVYTRSYSKITYADFASSNLAALLGEEYASTQWIWTQDTLFGDGEAALFIGRYVRSIEYSHEPGMLFFKMNTAYLASVFETEDLTEAVAFGIVTADGVLCTSSVSEGYTLKEEELHRLAALSAETAEEGTVTMAQTALGMLLCYGQAGSGLSVFTFVPNSTLSVGLRQMMVTLWVIYALIAALAVVLIVYFSRSLTEPILQLSDAMSAFDGSDYSKTVSVETNTELDAIGASYNDMLRNIEQLVEEIKAQDRALLQSELNILLAQINPHFLYNTLDTIYMLARINKEETTMKMIQALSKYLRLCLSKGNDMVTVADELENVKSYMEIQQIRDKDLFSYEIEATNADLSLRMPKLILQPLVENAIRHGFRDRFVGGRIYIGVEEVGDRLRLLVFNNGSPMDEEIQVQINELLSVPVSQMQLSFPERGHGFGIINIITRLRLKYEADLEFRYESSPSGTRCIISIPKEGGGEDEDL